MRISDWSSDVCSSDLRLRQILLNLLSNAIKFTPGGGTVLLRALTTPEGGCELQVEDNGIGMTEAEISLALQPFTQIDTSLSRRFEGKIGSASCRERVCQYV